MAVTGPEQNVDPPVAELPLHSLLESATIVDGGDDEKWKGGFQFQPEGCVEATAWDPCSQDSARAKADPTPAPGLVRVNPTMLIVPFQCTAGSLGQEEYAERAERSIDLAASKALEREFWTGEKGPTNPALRRIRTLLNDGDAVKPEQALIIGSQFLADCGPGTRGVFHVTAAVGEAMAHKGDLVEDDEGRLRTASRGDLVIVGSGYDGSGPLDTNPEEEDPDDQPAAAPAPAPGPLQSYIYVTGPVAVRIEDASVVPSDFRDAFDRSTNTVTFYGERLGAAAWDQCCGASILVDWF